MICDLRAGALRSRLIVVRDAPARWHGTCAASAPPRPRELVVRFAFDPDVYDLGSRRSRLIGLDGWRVSRRIGRHRLLILALTRKLPTLAPRAGDAAPPSRARARAGR